MVDLDVALTAEVCLEDIAVAMVPPPGAQLPVPGAVQHMEEFRVLHANHGEEVLVPQVAPEVVLVSKLLYPRRFQQMAVERRLAHGLQVQQHHSTVEARESFRRRVPNSGLGVLMAELPERVPVHRLHLSGYADNSAWQKVVELLKQLSDVGLILQVKVQLDDPRDLCLAWGPWAADLSANCRTHSVQIQGPILLSGWLAVSVSLQSACPE